MPGSSTPTHVLRSLLTRRSSIPRIASSAGLTKRSRTAIVSVETAHKEALGFFDKITQLAASSGSSAPVADAEAYDVATRDAIRRYKQDPGKEKLSNAKRYFDEAQKIMFKIEDDPQCRDAAVLDDALRKFEAARVDFEKLYKATEI